MKVIKSEYIVFCDCDDTLVMHDHDIKEMSNNAVYVKDPIRERLITMRINHPMVRLVQEEHARGAFVIVWSRGGHAWAEAVVKALHLTDCVNQVMSKPIAYFDDKDVSEWLKYRVYLTPDTKYKE